MTPQKTPRTLVRAAGLAAVCAIALPATASAAGTIVAGPLKVKDYKMTVMASDAAKDSLSVMFNRTAGKATQSHFYTFDDGVTVTAKRVKGDLGSYGKVDLKLTALGAAKRGVVPKGCTGKGGKVQKGKLAGTFKLVADSTYFETVSARSLKAQLARGGKLTCDGGGGDGGSGGGGGATTLSSTAQGADGMLIVSVTKDASGAVTQQAMRTDDPAKAAPASIMHLITAPGTASAFAPAGDLGSATGTGVSPFFSGSFDFAADTVMDTMAMGTLSGDFAADFDSIGKQSLTSEDATAMLTKR